MLILARWLDWADVDPATHPYDPAVARGAVEQVIDREVPDQRAWATRRPSIDRERVEDEISRALVSAVGPWAIGFRWAATEPGGGGPTRGWCCARDSVLVAKDTSPHDTVERAIAALADFRGFLEELAPMFAALAVAPIDSPEERIERAAAQLLPVVVARTGAEDAWYYTFGRVLAWFVQSIGNDDPRAREAIDTVVCGHFSSWVAPDTTTGERAALTLGITLGELAETPDATDALAVWSVARTRAFARLFDRAPSERTCPDGHAQFIEEREHARDPERAARMQRALHACRASARAGTPLDFAQLRDWQRIVLGRDVSFRRGDAFAKGGRERYALETDTQARFEACLREASGSDPVLVRAARAYLDVCFFHPFDDGNARAARLALDWVLSREGLCIETADPLFVIARSAADDDGASAFAWLLWYLVGRGA